jgi:hypothetical protein
MFMEFVGNDGYWYRLIVPKQCRSKCWMHGVRCQGVQGHDGFCWAYSPSGDLEQWASESKKGRALARKTKIAGSSTPAGHASWIHPKDMAKKYFRHGAKSVKTSRKASRDPFDEMPKGTLKKLEKRAKQAAKIDLSKL